MPTYNVQNEKTGEVQELFCSYDSRQKFLEENPGWKPCVDAPSLNYMGKSAIARTDSGWKDMLSRIGEAHPASDINKEHNSRSAKQVKIDKVLKDRGIGK
jgi:hypothetical protein